MRVRLAKTRATRGDMEICESLETKRLPFKEYCSVSETCES